jgi:hypothetical protein
MWLILTPNKQVDVTRLSQTACALGWSIFDRGWNIPKHILKAPGAVYGERIFCEVIAEQMGWKLLSNTPDWITTLPEEYVSRKISFTNLITARNITDEKFITSCVGKCFEAKVYSSGAELIANEDYDEISVLVSDVMKFTSKYRCFVKNKKVIAVCCYYYKDWNKEPEINSPANYNTNSEPVIKFVNDMLANEKVNCVASTCIDVGRFKKDTYAVINSKPSYMSGFYGCEIVAALDAIKTSCVSIDK